MRAETPGSELTNAQTTAAKAGLKALVPLANGKTLLDITLENLDSAGFTQFILVIGPEHDVVRNYCSANELNIRFAVQEKPLGTANAVLAVEKLIGDAELFGVFNSDNLYPVEGLRILRESTLPATLAFEREPLVRLSNIPEDRIAKFATIETDDTGHLTHIVEKPKTVNPDALISMNAWLFSTKIFEACRAIQPSLRGEYEIASAVEYAINNLSEKFNAIRTQAGVVDLSSRADIKSAEPFL
jgi:glucose-1-phosphate thymidylyltransferase